MKGRQGTLSRIVDAGAASWPAFLGYFPLGMAFGLIFVDSGVASWIWAPLMSLLVYAGAAQFVALSMVSGGASPQDLALSTLFINLRHAFYGLPFLNTLPRSRAAAAYFIFGLTDETYGLLTADPRLKEPTMAVLVTALTHAYWVIGTLVGSLVGYWVPWSLKPLEFCLIGLFAILAVEQGSGATGWLPVGIGVVTTLLVHLCVPQATLIVSMTLSAVFLVVHSQWSARGQKPCIS